MSSPHFRQRTLAPTPKAATPFSGFANAAQLSEIVCENTTQYSRIMMTLLTPVPGASHKKEEKKLYTMREATDSPPLHNRKDIFRRIKRPKRPALDIATPQMGSPRGRKRRKRKDMGAGNSRKETG